MKTLFTNDSKLLNTYPNLCIPCAETMYPYKQHEINDFFFSEDASNKYAHICNNNIVGIHWFDSLPAGKTFCQGQIDVNNKSVICKILKNFNLLGHTNSNNSWKYHNIPKIMFTYWYGPMSYLHYVSVKSFIYFNPDWKVQLYYPKYPSVLKPSWDVKLNCIEYIGPNWYIELEKLNIEFIPIDFNQINFSNDANEIIKSDYLRLYILSTQGGLWSDTDILYIKPMTSMILKEHLINGTENEIDTVISYHDNCKYYSIGFLLSSPNNVLFKYVFEQTKNNLNVKLYESIGSFLYKKLFDSPKKMVDMFPKINLVNLDLDFVYPVPSWHTPDIFYGNIDINFESNRPLEIEKDKLWTIKRYADDSAIKSNANRIIGIHWYNGHGKTKQFLNENNYNTNVTINNMIKKYLKNL